MTKIIKNKVYRNLIILSLVLLPIFFIVFHSLRTKSSDVNNLSKADYLDATQNQIVYLQVGEDLFTGNNQTSRRNNTVNLQRVIDNVSQSGGGTIVLPQGSFYFTQGGFVSITIVVSAVVGAVYLYKYAGKKIIKKI